MKTIEENINNNESETNKLVEIQRNNVTLAEFFSYIKNQCAKKGLDFGLERDRDVFENPPHEMNFDYFVKDGKKYFSADNGTRIEVDEPAYAQAEKLLVKPLNYQTYTKNHDGSGYNEICEFTYDDDKRGHGYYYQSIWGPREKEVNTNMEGTKMADAKNTAKTVGVKEASQKQVRFMEAIKEASGLDIPDEAKKDSKSAREWIQAGLKHCEENGIVIGKSTKAPEHAAKEATQKQLDFLEVLAEAIDVEVPEEALSDSRVASEFIKDALDFCKENGIVIGKSTVTHENIVKEATHKQQAFMQTISEASGLDIPDEAKKDSKSAHEWIQAGLKHCEENGIEIGKSTKAPENVIKEASQKQADFMQVIAEATGIAIPEKAYSDSKEASKYIKDGLQFCEENNIVILSEKQAVIQATKEALGSEKTFVTNAQKDTAYEGKFIEMSARYATQEMPTGKSAVIHDFENNPAVEAIAKAEMNKDISQRISYNIGYDNEGKASISEAAQGDEISEEKNRDEENER